MAEPVFYACSIPFSEQRSALRADVGRSAAQHIESIPGVDRLPADQAQVYVMNDFLGPEQCAILVGLIDAGSQPSDLFEAEKFQGYRTSSSCNLDRLHPSVLQTELAICGLLGLDPAHGEALQGQRYEAGQEFKHHADFFYIDQPYWEEVKPHGGQRTWTAMIYLDEPESGGATHFPHLEVTVVPKRGRLLAWNNMDGEGAPNSWTIHEGQPVGSGIKHIVTKWFREARWA